MTEPNVWRGGTISNLVCSFDLPREEPFVAKADFDRLRDERDRLTEELRSEWVALARERRADLAGARRVAGVLADALRNNAPCYCDHPLRAGLPPCSRCSALAVFDTLTEGEDR